MRKWTPWRSKVASGAVVLRGAGVGVPGQNLGVAYGHAGVEGVGDRRVPQRVRRRGGGCRQPSRSARPSGSSRAGRSACERGPQDEQSIGSFASAGLEDAQDRDGQRHGGGLLPWPTRGKPGLVTARHVRRYIRATRRMMWGADADRIKVGSVVWLTRYPPSGGMRLTGIRPWDAP